MAEKLPRTKARRQSWSLKRLAMACWYSREYLTPRLTGAGARSAEGTNISHENAEGMAYVGVRVEPPVRLGSVVEGGGRHNSLDWCLRITA